MRKRRIKAGEEFRLLLVQKQRNKRNGTASATSAIDQHISSIFIRICFALGQLLLQSSKKDVIRTKHHFLGIVSIDQTEFVITDRRMTDRTFIILGR